MEVKAALCREFGAPLSIETVSLAPPGPGEVQLVVKACAICHSDISYAEGAWGGNLPAIYGHEAAGIVEAVGPEVKGLKPGDHVVATLIRACGHCHYCSSSSPVMCEEVFPLDGRSPFLLADGTLCDQGMRTGAFAEKIVIHESQLVAIPEDLPFDVASLLACGVITGYGAVVNTAGVKAGQSVAIIGCGGVGLNAIQAARLVGADPVIAIDTDNAKLEAATGFGATDGFHPGDPDIGKNIRALTGGRGVDFVFVTVGVAAALDSAQRFIGRNGAAIIVGMPPNGTQSHYDPGKLAAWNQKIIGSKMGEARIASDIPALIGHYRAGRLKLDELVSGRFSLEEINAAIAGVKNGSALRNVIMFG